MDTLLLDTLFLETLLLVSRLLETCWCCGKPWLYTPKRCKTDGVAGKSCRHRADGHLLALWRTLLLEISCSWMPCHWQPSCRTPVAVGVRPAVGNLLLLWIPCRWKLLLGTVMLATLLFETLLLETFLLLEILLETLLMVVLHALCSWRSAASVKLLPWATLSLETLLLETLLLSTL